MNIEQFNIRIYGLLKVGNQVLITDEIKSGNKMTKFPGGGLEFGEGISDALIREFKEELAIDVKVGELFYVNDFLQVSAFCPSDQLISFYYWVEQVCSTKIETVHRPFENLNSDLQCFRWRDIDDLSPSEMTYPIDQLIVKKITK